MKLNPDCLRAILLSVENETDLDNSVVIGPFKMPSCLLDFPQNEVMYHVKQAELSNLILIEGWFVSGNCSIKYLTPEGHQFIGNIQSEKLWTRVKNVAKDAGVNTIPSLVQIASNIALSAVQSHL